MLLAMLHQDQAEIAQVGIKAIEQARAAGVAAYYVDESAGNCIIREMPDGSRQLIDVSPDKGIVLRALSPAQ